MIDRERESLETFDFEAGEILNVDKPEGITSFGVVERIRQWTRCRKVGHAGTLDPLASGVLLVCTGLATKRVSEFMALEKEYEGTVVLGKTTETDDAEGKILQIAHVPAFTEENITSTLRRFEGEIDQVPPMYSALKRNGRRLYQLARQGEVVPREPRKVHVYKLKLLEWKNPFLRIRVRCSKGTYIRALARDIGEQLSTGGYLTALRRTRIGTYTVEDSYSLVALQALFVEKYEHISIH